MKVIGPLFSLDAKGTIGKTLTYGKNQFGNWVRRITKRKYTLNEAQKEIRKWFKDGIVAFQDMSDEERFLWNLAVRNYANYGVHLAKYVVRWGRCLFLHHVLTDLSFTWRGSPFPPSLWQMLAKDKIEGYDQIMKDLETLTGLVFCKPVNPYFFKYLGIIRSPGHPHIGEEVDGFCNHRGIAIALCEDRYYSFNDWHKKHIIAHELTHAIMEQHGWDYRNNVSDSEAMADECGVRVASGELTPVYTYKGKTLSEWVDDPECH